MRPAVEACAGGAGAVGDALHLFEVFLVVAAEEQGVDEGARRLPAVGRAPWDFAARREQRIWAAISGASSRPCCYAALVGLALDVQDDPAGLRIAIRPCRTVAREAGSGPYSCLARARARRPSMAGPTARRWPARSAPRTGGLSASSDGLPSSRLPARRGRLYAGCAGGRKGPVPFSGRTLSSPSPLVGEGRVRGGHWPTNTLGGCGAR